MLTAIKTFVRRFRDSDKGSMAAEMALIMPLLAWWFAGSFVFYDAFRSHNISVKTTYTVADLLSRQTEIDNDYIEGLQTVTDFLTTSTEDMWIRVSSVTWDGSSYTVDWSYGTDNHDPLTDDMIVDNAIDDQYLPVLSTGESVIVTESWIPYTPPFSAGVSAKTWFNVVITRPRFTSKLANADFSNS